MNAKADTLSQLQYIREKGFPGIVFYSYRNPNQGQPDQKDVFTFVQEKFQPTWEDPPALIWKQTKGIIKGTVINTATERPVYNALVTLDTEPRGVQRTEVHGTFAFFNLQPGKYKLTAELGSSQPTIRSVTVREGQVLDVELRVQP